MEIFPVLTDKEISRETCMHGCIRSDGACLDCGRIVNELYNINCNISNSYYQGKGSSNNNGILDDMKGLAIPDEIKLTANTIYHQMNLGTRRAKKRKLLIFFCLYQAYKIKNITEVPRHLANKVGISPGEITKAISLFSGAQTGFHSGVKKSSALDFIPCYLEYLGNGLINTVSVLEFAKEIMKKSQLLNDPSKNLYEDNPQKVAIGIIQYFMDIHGISYDKAMYAKNMGLSEVTIFAMNRLINYIHNEII